MASSGHGDRVAGARGEVVAGLPTSHQSSPTTPPTMTSRKTTATSLPSTISAGSCGLLLDTMEELFHQLSREQEGAAAKAPVKAEAAADNPDWLEFFSPQEAAVLPAAVEEAIDSLVVPAAQGKEEQSSDVVLPTLEGNYLLPSLPTSLASPQPQPFPYVQQPSLAQPQPTSNFQLSPIFSPQFTKLCSGQPLPVASPQQGLDWHQPSSSFGPQLTQLRSPQPPPAPTAHGGSEWHQPSSPFRAELAALDLSPPSSPPATPSALSPPSFQQVTFSPLRAQPSPNHLPSLSLHSTTTSNAPSLPPTTCTHCGTSQTSLWRRDASGRPLCNACKLYLKVHGAPRPLTWRRDVTQRRRRQARQAGQARDAKRLDTPSKKARVAK